MSSDPPLVPNKKESSSSLERAQTQYKRKLAIQQELAKMDHYASGVEDFLAEGYRSTSGLFAPIDNISHSSRSSCSSQNSHASIPPGFHSPPEGAVETARKFLWDEDDDDISLPPIRDFDGRQHNVPTTPQEGSATEETPPTPQASNSYKKDPTSGGLVWGVLNRFSKKRYSPLDQQENLRNTEMVHADAASTISSNEDIDNQGGAIVTIDLGGPADTGNRQQQYYHAAESKASWCCKTCFARVRYGCCRMLGCCTCCCRGMSCCRRKVLLLLVVLLGIPLIALSVMALLKNHGGSDDMSHNDLNNQTNTTTTLVPTILPESTLSPTMIAPNTTAEPTLSVAVPTLTPSTNLNTTVVPNATAVPTATQSPTNMENQTQVVDDSPSPSPTTVVVNETTPTLTPTTATTPSPSVVSSVVVTPENGTAPFDLERYEALKSLIVKSGITTAQQMELLGTAQNKALLWLVDYDAAKVDPNNQDVSLQRYALATLFFSTTYKSGPIPHYDTVQQAMNAALTNPKPHNWKRGGDTWMTSSHICEWEGVVCGAVSNKNNNNETEDDTLRQKSLQNEQAVIHFNLTANGLEGELPSEIAALTELKTLNLSNNSLSGPIPASIGEMSKLAVLFLSHNQLADHIPSELGRATGLMRLSLENNRLVGSIPPELSKLKELHVLRLQENQLTGILPDLTGLDELHTLLLNNNAIGGTVSKAYGSLLALKTLDISSNVVHGTLPFELSMLTNLEFLAMGHNKFYGTVPDMFQKMRALRELQLGKNNFVGSLPKTLGELLLIRNLSFEDNEFSGTIPIMYGNLKTLESLYLFNNKLTGFIPSVMDGWEVSMTDFRAHHNKLVGTIPPAFGSATKIEILQLEDNNLGGTVPTSIGQLSQLQSFRIYNNNLTGVVPKEVCSLIKNDKLEFLAADCARKGGTIQCDCCQECHPI